MNCNIFRQADTLHFCSQKNKAIHWMVFCAVGAYEFYLQFYLFCLLINQIFIECLLYTRYLARNWKCFE